MAVLSPYLDYALLPKTSSGTSDFNLFLKSALEHHVAVSDVAEIKVINQGTFLCVTVQRRSTGNWTVCHNGVLSLSLLCSQLFSSFFNQAKICFSDTFFWLHQKKPKSPNDLHNGCIANFWAKEETRLSRQITAAAVAAAVSTSTWPILNFNFFYFWRCQQ